MNLKLTYILLIIVMFYGCKIDIKIREQEHHDFGVLPKNHLWKKLLFYLLAKYDSDKTVWTSGYVTFDLDIDDFISHI